MAQPPPAMLNRLPPRALAEPPSPAPSLDISLCEREPIHIPGAIQPHGALLAVLAGALSVTHASANLVAILGCPAEAVLGRPLAEAIGEAASRVLLEGFRGAESAYDRVHLLSRPQDASLYMRSFRSGRHICIDIETMNAESSRTLPIQMAQSVVDTFKHAATGSELCGLAVHGIRAIAGYDRVMAYRFEEDGHGEVIAEACAGHLERYLGLRYPASDIPPQARRLYLRQRVGAIADSSYRPVPLLVDPALDDGEPLDLTSSALRSVSPVHCQYMRNMNTAASLTVALAQGPNLWGMLVCHHGSARVVGPELRAAADMIGQVASLMLASLGEAEVYAHRLERNVTLRDLVGRLAAPLSLPDAFAAAGAELLMLVDAAGAVVRLSGSLLRLKQTPPLPAAERALAVLQLAAVDDVLAIEDLGLRYPELSACTSQGSGALLLRLPSGNDDAILWFRPELSRTITWGGNPAEHGTMDSAGARISPRTSFAAWKETVSGRSASWTRADLALARELRGAVEAEVAQRTKAALRESEARLGLLAEHSGVVVALSDLEGIRRYVSPAAERVLGWRAEDMVGRAAMEFVHPDDQQTLREANKTLLTGSGQSSACYRHLRPDGSWLWVDGHARLRTRADDKAPKDYVVVLRDATERKAAEQKLLDALDRMERMAATDGLTGLSNRRHLDEVADREWRRCTRDRLPLSALLLDADRFKLFNDRYGHLAGDDCLRAIAAQLDAVAQRPGDLAARYGGEEFAVLMPATELAGATAVAEHLCELVEDQRIVHDGNEAKGVVTVSIGVATAWPAEPRGGITSVHALLSAADAALYRAKSGGRNRVVADGLS